MQREHAFCSRAFLLSDSLRVGETSSAKAPLFKLLSLYEEKKKKKDIRFRSVLPNLARVVRDYDAPATCCAYCDDFRRLVDQTSVLPCGPSVCFCDLSPQWRSCSVWLYRQQTRAPCAGREVIWKGRSPWC